MLFGSHPVVERVEVLVPSLHPALDGLRIVQLSDLHYLPFTKLGAIQAAVEKANCLQPDLIVLTGDYISHEADTIFGLRTTLSKLNARLGVFAILGNHDARAGARIISQGIAEAGIPLLRNTNVTLSMGHGSFNLAGIDDCLWGQPDLAATLDGLNDAHPTILLAHEPDKIDEFSETGRIQLQLSGHTHGGQVRLPFWGTPVLPKLGEKYVQGLHCVNNTWLYINRGIGMVFLPIRFNAPPEVTELTLHR
ncbi:MAG: metallophosphoesterase [Caldilineaceae bacterium]